MDCWFLKDFAQYTLSPLKKKRNKTKEANKIIIKSCTTIVSVFSWVLKSSPEKERTMLDKIFCGKRCIIYVKMVNTIPTYYLCVRFQSKTKRWNESQIQMKSQGTIVYIRYVLHSAWWNNLPENLKNQKSYGGFKYLMIKKCIQLGLSLTFQVAG